MDWRNRPERHLHGVRDSHEELAERRGGLSLELSAKIGLAGREDKGKKSFEKSVKEVFLLLLNFASTVEGGADFFKKNHDEIISNLSNFVLAIRRVRYGEKGNCNLNVDFGISEKLYFDFSIDEKGKDHFLIVFK